MCRIQVYWNGVLICYVFEGILDSYHSIISRKWVKTTRHVKATFAKIRRLYLGCSDSILFSDSIATESDKRHRVSNAYCDPDFENLPDMS